MEKNITELCKTTVHILDAPFLGLSSIRSSLVVELFTTTMTSPKLAFSMSFIKHTSCKGFNP